MTSPTKDLAERYERAVQRESAAWQALQLHATGSPGRAEAWLTWTQAISCTNAAWRELNRRGLNRAQPADGQSTVNTVNL